MEVQTYLDRIKDYNRQKKILFPLLLLLISFIFFAYGIGTEKIVIISFGLFLLVISVVFFIFEFRQQQKLLFQSERFLIALKNYLQHLEKILISVRENDFSEEFTNPEEAEILEDFDKLQRIVRAAGEKFKLVNQQNQRISFELVKSIQTLAEAGNIQASASSEQASSIAEITATMEELARTAAQIAENSNKVAGLAENSDQASKEGFALVNNVIRSIEQIDGKMKHIAEKTQVLGDKSKQIGKVLEIIYDIANETHLLALNAAIESVAAGEYGKRFGVIAAEVRRLAESARENAEAIKETIEQFQQAIDATILAIEDGSKMTSEVNTTAQEIIRHLEKIVQATAYTSQSSSEISIATQQQKTASDQIVLTLKDISQVTKQQAQELKRSSRELENINNLALRLQLLTQQTVIDSPLSLGYKVKKFARHPQIISMDRKLQQQALANFVEENNFVEMIYVADQEGKMFSFQIGKEINSELNVTLGMDFSSRGWFVNARMSKHPVISEVYRSLLTNQDCFTVSIGLFRDEEWIGVLGIDINAREWNKILS